MTSVGHRGDARRSDARTLLALVTLIVSSAIVPVRAFPQKRAITVESYLALPVVGDPQLSADGKWVAYTVTEYSLKENRGSTPIWLAGIRGGGATTEDPPP